MQIIISIIILRRNISISYMKENKGNGGYWIWVKEEVRCNLLCLSLFAMILGNAGLNIVANYWKFL
jgi:hypothetical protein